MPKGLKVVMLLVVLLMLGVGISYGLAKMQVIPTQKMGQKNHALGAMLNKVGLYKAAAPVKPGMPALPSTPSPEQQALKAQRDALEQEKAAFEVQKQAQQKTEAKTKQAAAIPVSDPHELARLASVYEQMPAESVTKIFAKLPDTQVVALMRQMDEKRVGEVLASLAPERAAFFTQQLSHAATTEVRTAANTP